MHHATIVHTVYTKKLELTLIDKQYGLLQADEPSARCYPNLVGGAQLSWSCISSWTLFQVRHKGEVSVPVGTGLCFNEVVVYIACPEPVSKTVFGR